MATIMAMRSSTEISHWKARESEIESRDGELLSYREISNAPTGLELMVRVALATLCAAWDLAVERRASDRVEKELKRRRDLEEFTVSEEVSF
jgi:hypothetical protein